VPVFFLCLLSCHAPRHGAGERALDGCREGKGSYLDQQARILDGVLRPDLLDDLELDGFRVHGGGGCCYCCFWGCCNGRLATEREGLVCDVSGSCSNGPEVMMVGVVAYPAVTLLPIDKKSEGLSGADFIHDGASYVFRLWLVGEAVGVENDQDWQPRKEGTVRMVHPCCCELPSPNILQLGI